MTVSVLVISIALAMLVAAWRKSASSEIAALAISSAFGLMLIDVVYAARGGIAPLHLGDAALEALFVAIWLFLLRRRGPRRTHKLVLCAPARQTAPLSNRAEGFEDTIAGLAADELGAVR